MSKIGRRPIALNGVHVEMKGNEIHFKGKNASGVHAVPEQLHIEMNEEGLKITARDEKPSRITKELWGLHRALLANKIHGAQGFFEKQIQIVGLGFKAALQGSVIEFNLGFSHKKHMTLPAGITAEIDKTGQMLTLRSSDKELVGQFCGEVKRLRPTEPYKGTGIRLSTDVIRRKAGKTKGA